MKSSVFFLGPLPPPLHGFSWVNKTVSDLLASRSIVKIFNRAASPDSKGRSGIFLSLAIFFEYIFCFLKGRPKAVYIGWSGGKGMVVDFFFVIVALIFRVPVYVHHHAFSYLNGKSTIYAMTMWVLKYCNNVVLCSYMGDLLSSRYAVSSDRIFPLSNAAFLDDVPVSRPLVQDSISVGFISNITREKGIFDFFDLAESIAGEGAKIQFVIAGPVDKSIESEFVSRLKEVPSVSHIGPVYGKAKDDFFLGVDVLAFPTRYANEAEPVTIVEAFRSGVPVIANLRGCIGTMLTEICGVVVDQPEDFVSSAKEKLIRWSAHPDELIKASSDARARFDFLHAENVTRLDYLLSKIVKGEALGDQY